MGRYINPDERMSDEDKEFLRLRSRGDEVIENERRFPDEAEPAPHEADGYMPTKVGYDYEKQAAKVEDAGGLQVERIPTDNEGRPMVAEYGYVEGIIHTDDLPDEDDEVEVELPTEPEDEPEPVEEETPEPADSDDDDLDDDILERVIDMNVDEMKTELERLGEEKSGNRDELIDRLANALQDERDKLDAENEHKG